MNQWVLLFGVVAVVAAVVLFRLPVGRIITVAVVVLAALWVYAANGGDPQAMFDSAYATAHTAVLHLRDLVTGVAGQVSATVGK